MTHDIAIIGGGLVGLSTAYKLLLGNTRRRVVVLEKEADVGRHQSSHNSGVLHAGLHYTPGSRKARLAPAGMREMLAFCRTHGIAHAQCGKVIGATRAEHRPRLEDLWRRGTANGLRDLRLLDDREVRALEPHAAGVAGLHVPEEGIVDYAAVCGTLRRLVEERGGALLLGARVNAIARRANQWTLETNASPVTARILVNAAGLHADRVARLAGERPIVRIIPFRGEYWQLAPTRTHLVRNLIYPVPNPSLPFLGVHFTRRITGGVEAGPNAVLALSREGYRRSQANLRDLAGVLLFPGLWRFLARYPRTTVHELARSFSKALFVRSLRRLVPEISAADLVPGPSGVRAQAMRPDGTLVEDFELIVRPNAVHVLNAPSPAATASLAIGGEIADLVSGIGR